jgi:hypothetical protein
MKIKIFGGLLVAILTITSMAQAQTRTPVITHRQHIQDRRINHGVRSGQLTRNEAHHMRADERKISRDKRMARVDDHVSVAERRHLGREENRTSQAIYRHEHNERIR